MIEKSFSDVYTKFKMCLYSKVFKEFNDNNMEALSAVEVLCMEIIVALDNPTVNEFASFARLSAPNATYKVNKLIKKGYLKKARSDKDKREYHLTASKKYIEHYGIIYDYISSVTSRMKERFSEEDIDKFDEMLRVTSADLMPEAESAYDIFK